MDSDEMRRFLFDGSNLRGVRVHLTEVWRELLSRHTYDEAVRSLLGESIAAVSLLGATIKFDGSLIMQMSGDGPVPMVVVQSTGARTVRGMASVRGEITGSSMQQLVGDGHLALTIDPGPDKERCQGIVALEGPRLATTIDSYFVNSEQLLTRLWLAADANHAAGMLLQALPSEDPETDSEGWQHLIALADTVQPTELLELDSHALLRRLFHAEPVRMFAPEPIRFSCGCSGDRVSGMLRAMPLEELLETAGEEGGVLAVTCDFCNAKYVFDLVDLEALFAGGAEQLTKNSTKH